MGNDMYKVKIRNDLTNQIFTRLTVIDRAPDIITQTYIRSAWNCICKCNNKLIVMGSALTTGSTKSCGCLKSESVSKCTTLRNKNNQYGRKYTKLISVARIPYDQFYNDGDLSFEQFYELSQQKCFYCAIDPSNMRKINNIIFKYNGLDRIDNNYTHNINNIITSCKVCNWARKKTPINNFIIHIYKLITTEHIDIIKYKQNMNKIQMCDLNKLYFGSSVKNVFHHRYNDGDLTIDQMYKLSQLNCYYCGGPPENICSRYKKHYEEGKFIYNGLDRINNTLKHNYDNVITCCKYCNIAKKNMTIANFFSWIDRLHNNYHNMIQTYGDLNGK